MGVKATELRKGQVIEKDGDLLVITEYEHRTPGNLRAIINIKARSLGSGQTTAMRLSSSDVLEVAFLDRRKCQYLYREGNGDRVFMDNESYEQFHLSEALIGERMGYVKENSVVEVTFHNQTPIDIALPKAVELEITAAEAAVKGNTATSVKKDATLETGLVIKVPLHIGVGDVVKVNTETSEFLGRAN